MNFKGYLFENEIEAQEAVDMINDFFNVPKNNDSITRNWIDYEVIEKIVFIRENESLIHFLGEPIEISINFE